MLTFVSIYSAFYNLLDSRLDSLAGLWCFTDVKMLQFLRALSPDPLLDPNSGNAEFSPQTLTFDPHKNFSNLAM